MRPRCGLWVLVGGLVLPTTGCYSSPEGFINGAAKHGCIRIRECEGSRFESQFDGDMGKCRDDQVDALEDAWDIAEDLGCEYLPDEGRECIAALRRNNRECTQDGDEEIVAECGSSVLDPGLDYLDCG